MKGMPPIFRDSHLENTFAIRKLRINRMNLNQNQDQNIIESLIKLPVSFLMSLAFYFDNRFHRPYEFISSRALFTLRVHIKRT